MDLDDVLRDNDGLARVHSKSPKSEEAHTFSRSIVIRGIGSHPCIADEVDE